MPNLTLFIDLTPKPKINDSPATTGYLGQRPWTDLFFYGKEADGCLLRESAPETDEDLKALGQRLSERRLSRPSLPRWTRIILLIDDTSNTAWPLRIRLEVILESLPEGATTIPVGVIRLNGSARKTAGIPDATIKFDELPEPFMAKANDSGKSWSDWLWAADVETSQIFNKWKDDTRRQVCEFVNTQVQAEDAASGRTETIDQASNVTDLRRANRYHERVKEAWRGVRDDFACGAQPVTAGESRFLGRLKRCDHPQRIPHIPQEVFYESVNFHFGFATENRALHLIDLAASEEPSRKEEALYLVKLVEFLASDTVWKEYLGRTDHRHHEANVILDLPQLQADLSAYGQRVSGMSERLAARRGALARSSIPIGFWSAAIADRSLSFDASEVDGNLREGFRDGRFPLLAKVNRDAEQCDPILQELSKKAADLAQEVDQTCRELQSDFEQRLSKITRSGEEELQPIALQVRRKEEEAKYETNGRAQPEEPAKASRGNWPIVKEEMQARVSELRRCRPRLPQVMFAVVSGVVVLALGLVPGLIGDASAGWVHLAAVPASGFLLAPSLVFALLWWQRHRYVSALRCQASRSFHDFQEKEDAYFKRWKESAKAATARQEAARNIEEIDRALGKRRQEDKLLEWHVQQLATHAELANSALSLIDPGVAGPVTAEWEDFANSNLNKPPQSNPHYRLHSGQVNAEVSVVFGDAGQRPVRLGGIQGVERFELRGRREP